MIKGILFVITQAAMFKLVSVSRTPYSTLACFRATALDSPNQLEVCMQKCGLQKTDPKPSTVCQRS